jgi:hypothetical protein
MSAEGPQSAAGFWLAFPYSWVPQWHPGGHDLPAHCAVGRLVLRRLIERCWGHGFVHIKLLDGLPVLAARYLARYVSHDVESAHRLAGLHRMSVCPNIFSLT